MKPLKKIFLFLNAILILFSILAIFSPYVDPGKVWYFSFLGLFFPLFILGNFIFVLLWLLWDWKYSWMSILLLLAGIFVYSYLFSFKGTAYSEDQNLSVASFNMNYGYGTFRKGSYTYDADITAQFKSFLTDSIRADVLCGQEINSFIEALLEKDYPYMAGSPKTRTTIFSKFPIIHKGTIDFGGITNSCVWADILIGTDTIRVYSAHFQSNNITKDTDEIIEEVEKNQSLRFIQLRSVLSKYKRNVVIRADQAKRVREHMNNCPYPIVMGVDLNDPPFSYTHRTFSADLQDAFAVQGVGFGASYAGKIPLLRIDNLFFSNDFEITSYRVMKKKYSDHYAIKSTVLFKNN